MIPTIRIRRRTKISGIWVHQMHVIHLYDDFWRMIIHNKQAAIKIHRKYKLKYKTIRKQNNVR